MKQKTKAFLEKVLSDPGITATDAYLATHTTDNRNSARSSASQLLATTNARIYMQKHVERAKKRVIELVDSKNEAVAFRASESIIDRVHGKATQTHEIQSNKVRINIDLSNKPTPGVPLA